MALPEPFLCCFRPSASAVSSCADESAVSASADESAVAASADESGVAASADEADAAIANRKKRELRKKTKLLTVMAVTVRIGIINDTDEGDGDDHHEDDDERRGWRVNYNDGEGGRCSDNQYENDVDDGN